MTRSQAARKRAASFAFPVYAGQPDTSNRSALGDRFRGTMPTAVNLTSPSRSGGQPRTASPQQYPQQPYI